MWRSGWLQLIPKPNKPPNRPQHLRPLAIQCPLGKAVLGLLIRIASKQTESEFRKWPIWAFMPKRSTQDPLLKVASHCRDIQTLVDTQKSTPHSRAAQIPQYSCFGGLQIFIDIDKAFDSINRTKLFCRLHQLQIDEAVIQLLQRWHFDTSYFVTHGGECVEVKVNRGLRQGCKGAPYLWNCMIILLLHDLQATVSLDWICTHLTIYADDCHVGGVFTNVEEFNLLLHALGQLFSLLHAFDLTISPQKSVAILCMRGHLGRKARAAHTQRDHKGEQIKIQLPDATVMLIPVQKSANYLGCVIGYHNFADSTTWHRVKLARAGFSRLRRWLCNRTHFSIQQRVRLWRCCILPIMTYGVFAVGTTPKGIQHMITQIGLMLRTIVRDHPHHTGNSHEQVFSAFALPRPAALLTAAVDSFQRSLTQRESLLQADDLARTLNWDHLALIRTQIAEVQADLARRRVETALSGEVQGSELQYHCRLCSFCTDHVSAFRRHCTVEHGTQMYRHFNISMHEYCTDGLPQCKYCHHSFSTWRSFRIHIERGCQALLLGPAHCTGIPLKATMTSSLKLPTAAASARGLVMLNDADLSNLLAQPWGQRVLGMIADDRLCQLEQEPEACKYLCKFCFLCGQHAHRIQDMHWHLSTEHPQYWTHVPAKSRMLCNQYCTDSPCQFCGSGFRTHQCPIWAQMAILVLHGGGLATPGPVQIQTQLEAIHRCDVCFELFNDSAQLIQHLQRVHKIAGVSFNVARDSLDGQAACAHCGKIYSSLEGLRSHIVQGRCPEFNPAAETETVPIPQAWHDLCLHGTMFSYLQPPMTRLHLTIRCSQCQQVYTRAGDLANHLMTSHAKLWRQAQSLTLVLVELVFARLGCVCNPQIHQVRQNHICLPLRQIAMMYIRLEQVPFMPIPVTEEVLHQLVHPSIPRPMQFRLTKLFADRQFSDMWTDAEVKKMLSHACIMCGQAHLPGLLSRHLHESHTCGHQFADFYSDTLLPVFQHMMQSDYQCDFCGQIFNLPCPSDEPDTTAARQQLVQIHLRGNCPVLLQTALLLGTALNGGRLGYEWLGRDGTGRDQRNLSVLSADLRQELEASTQPQGNETTQNRGQGRPDRSRSTRTRTTEGDPAVPAGPGPTGAATRAQLELAAKYRLFHTVLPAGQGGQSPGHASGNPTLAAASQEEPHGGDQSPQTTPLYVVPEGLADPGHQSLRVQSGGPPCSRPAWTGNCCWRT